MSSSKDVREGLEKVFDFIGEIIAVLALIVFVVCILNSNFGFIKNETVVKYMLIAKEWSGLLLIAVVGFEATIKRNIVIRIIFYILLAIAVLFLFFPGTYNSLIDQASAIVKK